MQSAGRPSSASIRTLDKGFRSKLVVSLSLPPILLFLLLASWNVFACNVNESLMRDTMDAFVTLGLRDAGYVYVGV